jgi:signal transduction histidine kinase
VSDYVEEFERSRKGGSTMRRQIESAVPPSFDARSWTTRFESGSGGDAREPIRIELDVPGGAALVSEDPRELDELFESLVVNVEVLMRPGGRLTIHLSPDDFENMPDEDEIADPARWLHLAIEDRGVQPVGSLFRRLLDPLVNVAPQLAVGSVTLRWSGRLLFEEGDAGARVIHLLLPYAAESEAMH